MRSQLLSLTVLGCVPCVDDVSGNHGKVLGLWFDMVKKNTMHSAAFRLFVSSHTFCSAAVKQNTPYCMKPSQIIEFHSLFTLRALFTQNKVGKKGKVGKLELTISTAYQTKSSPTLNIVIAANPIGSVCCVN